MLAGSALILTFLLPIVHISLFKSKIPPKSTAFNWLVLEQPIEFLEPVYSRIVEFDRAKFNSPMILVAKKSNFAQMKAPDLSPRQSERILWQRTFPAEYQKLLKKAEFLRKSDDPFAKPFTILDKEISPSSFGALASWERGLTSHVFAQLGHQIEPGKSAIYWERSSGLISIKHNQDAIAAFNKRFPEFKNIETE